MVNAENMAKHYADEEKAGVAYVEGTGASGHQYQGNHNHASIGQYLTTRFTTLKPTFTIPPNPIKSLALLSRKDWLFFSVGASPEPVLLMTDLSVRVDCDGRLDLGCF